MVSVIAGDRGSKPGRAEIFCTSQFTQDVVVLVKCCTIVKYFAVEVIKIMVKPRLGAAEIHR